MPILKSLSQTGLITIVWDRQMQVPLDLRQIPRTKYIVLAEDQKIRIEDNGRRALGWEWVDTSEEYLRYLQIIDALEIKVVS